MGETRKVKSAGRFGSRYGVGIRKKLLKVESPQLEKKACPNCGSVKVKRKSKGVFMCRKCSHEFVGGAYMPQTLAGTIISKIVSQKSFAKSASELAQVSGVETSTVEGSPAEAEMTGEDGASSEDKSLGRKGKHKSEAEGI